MGFEIIMDGISFSGIKNIGVVKFNRFQSGYSRSLSMVLSDDYNGKDLKEFYDVVDKITDKKSSFMNSEGRDILNIECIKGEDEQRVLFVNGQGIEVNDKNIPMFSYIAKITRKIATMEDKNMIVNNDYKNFVANNTLVYDTQISDYVPFNIEGTNFFDQFFEKDIVRDGAKRVNNFIQKIMDRYFDIR